MLPPVSIADKSSGARPYFRLAGVEIPPENRLNTEDRQKVGRDASNPRARGLRSSRNGRDVVVVFSDRLEAAALVSKIVEVRIRHARRPAFRGDLEDSHDPVRIGVRQWPQQHAVHNAEIAVVTPMPSARVRTATAVKPGFLRSSKSVPAILRARCGARCQSAVSFTNLLVQRRFRRKIVDGGCLRLGLSSRLRA